MAEDGRLRASEPIGVLGHYAELLFLDSKLPVERAFDKAGSTY